MSEQPDLKEEGPELEKLIKEKVRLAKKLGIMGEGVVSVEGYKETDEYKRINEIDLRLWELVK
ncbi:hypothetical protein D3C75_488800 [compost metagenome]